MSTITIRRPTAPPPARVVAPAFTLDSVLGGRRIGLRTDSAWRSWALIANEWEKRLRDEGADVLCVETGAQVGDHGRADRQTIEEWSGEIDCGIVGPRHVRFVHVVHDQATRSTLEPHDKPVGRGRDRGVRDPRPQHGAAPRPRRPQGARAAVPARSPSRRRAARRSPPSTTRRRWTCSGCSDDGRRSRPSRSRSRPTPPRSTSCRSRSAGATAHRCSRRPTTAIARPARGDALPGRPRGRRAAARSTASRPSSSSRSTPRWPACEPAAFPLVLAALEAMLVPEWNAFGLTTTTSSVFPMLIVNGPCRDELGIDYRAGCMGGAAGRGSMTIGRAVSLCLRNIGGQRAGETSRTVFGQPARFGLCFGEWEERSPWPSLAERRGFDAARRRRDGARREGHVPARRHPQRRPAGPALPDRQEHRVPAQRTCSSATPRTARSSWRSTRCGPSGSAPAFPDVEDAAGVPAGARVAADRRCGPRRTRRSCGARTASTTRVASGCVGVARTRSCRSCAAASAACTPSRCRASARASCRASASSRRVPDRMMDQQAVVEAVDEMGALLRSDGADLCSSTPTPRPRASCSQLELDGAECAECVLPADLLEQMVSEALSRRVPGEFELVLRDPRRDEPPA